MEAIASELNLTIKEVPKKIKVLRSTYYLELAKIEKVKPVVQALILYTSLYCRGSMIDESYHENGNCQRKGDVQYFFKLKS